MSDLHNAFHLKQFGSDHMFIALSVVELGNKSIMAWPPSKDCIRLGSSGIEPTVQRREK